MTNVKSMTGVYFSEPNLHMNLIFKRGFDEKVDIESHAFKATKLYNAR